MKLLLQQSSPSEDQFAGARPSNVPGQLHYADLEKASGGRAVTSMPTCRRERLHPLTGLCGLLRPLSSWPTCWSSCSRASGEISCSFHGRSGPSVNSGARSCRRPWASAYGSWCHQRSCMRTLSTSLLNMYALYLFGRDVERELGAARFLAMYSVAVVTAGLIQLLVVSASAGPPYPTLGRLGRSVWRAAGLRETVPAARPGALDPAHPHACVAVRDAVWLDGAREQEYSARYKV